MKTEENNRLTFNSGNPVTDNQNVMTVGERGPVLMENIWLQEKLATFNRERIPERVVHAKGSGAFGYFTVTQDITKYTSASLFSRIGKQTPVFVRFSTVAGEKGSADTERDVRGFAIKFYTDSGNWDLVGNNTPVFFIRDPLKFPDFIHSQKRNPVTNLRSNTAMWDFWSLSPETMHQVLILMSDRGIPASYRHMHGYGSHTYSFINWQNNRVWVKFHFITQQGIQNFTNEEASQMIALDRDAAQRDLYRSIASGNYPTWKMYVQIMTEHEAVMYKVNPFDLTKVWSHKDFPLIEVGILELSINPDNYFAQVEQAAFNPANIVSGIGFSPDRMLQGRLFAYGDAQRYRLGVNHDKIIINSPHSKVLNYHRDGLMRTDENGGSDVNYEPNSFNGPKTDTDSYESKIEIIASAMHYDHRRDGDYYSQPKALYELMQEDERDRVVLNIVETLLDVPDFIQLRSAARLYLIHKQLGLRVAALIHLKDDQIVREATNLLNDDLIHSQK